MSFNTPAFPDYTASFNQSTQTGKFLSIPADPDPSEGEGEDGFEHPWRLKDASSFNSSGNWIPRLDYNEHGFDDYTVTPPSFGSGLSGRGFLVGSQNGRPDVGYFIISPRIVTDDETNITTLEWTSDGGIISGEEYEALESTLDVPIVVIGSYSVSQTQQEIFIRQFVYTRLGLRLGCWNGLAVPILMPI
jgi:hypothetical protein